jgi:putative oxidoreductase
MSREFTLEELKNYNGLNNKPAYIAYKGKVYDVSGLFKNGEHAGVKAGIDLTSGFGQGPHQEDIFANFKVLGTLVIETSLVQKIFQGSPQKADVVLRLALGLIFFAHGAQKLLGWFGGYGWEGTMGFFTQSLGLPSVIGALTILIEFFGGIALILGLLTRPAALGIVAVTLGAIFKVHLTNGFFLDGQGPKDGIEYLFILLLLSVYLLVKGAGQISLDKVITEKIAK